MKFAPFLLMTFFFISCGTDNDIYNDNDFSFDTDNDEEFFDDEVKNKFDFSLESQTIEGTISRDIASCGEFVVGCGEDSGNAFVFKMKDGSVVWRKELDEYFVQSLNSVSCDPVNGRVIVGGDRTKAGETRSSGFIAVLDRNGEVVWEENIRSEGSAAVYSVAYTDLGFFIIGGRKEVVDEDTGLKRTDGFMSKYYIDGERVFTTVFGTPSFDTVQSVAMGADRFYFAGGYSAGNMATGSSVNNSETGMSGFLVKLKPNGDIHWRKNIDMNTVWKINSKQSGLLFVGGEKTVDKKRYGIVIQTGLDGRSQFEHHFDSHNGVTVTGIDIDHRETIYITGYIDSDFSKKYELRSDDIISNTNNIFLSVFNIRTKESLYTKFYGSRDQDLVPKVVLDDNLVPHVLHYSLESFQSREGYVTMTRFLSSDL